MVGTVHANDVSGSYSRSLAPHDLDGTDSVQVFYRSPGGDLVYGYAHAPHMVVRQNATNEVLANTYVDQPLRVELRSAGGVLLATASVTSTGPGGLTSLRFRRDGAPVPITAGRRVIATNATDAKMKVPSLALVLDTAEDEVSGTCFKRLGLRRRPDGRLERPPLRRHGTLGRCVHGVALRGPGERLAGAGDV